MMGYVGRKDNITSLSLLMMMTYLMKGGKNNVLITAAAEVD